MKRLLAVLAPLLGMLLATTAGLQAQLATTKTSLSFGSVTVFASKSDSFYVKNSTQLGYALTGATNKSSRFTVSGTVTGIVADSVKIRVTFSPDSVGALLDTLIITHSVPNLAPLKVVLSGTGVLNIRLTNPRTAALVTSLAMVDTFATHARRDSLMMKNDASDPVTVSSISTANPEFKVLTPFPFTVAGKDSQKIVIVYQSTSVGRDRDTLVIAHNSPVKAGSPIKLPITARAISFLRFSLAAVFLDNMDTVRVSATSAGARGGSVNPPIAIDSARIALITVRNLILNPSLTVRVDSINFTTPHFYNITPTPYTQRSGEAYDRILQFVYQPKDLSSPVHRDTMIVFTNDTIPGGNRITMLIEGASTRKVYVRNTANGTSLNLGSVPLGTFADGIMRIYNFQDISLKIDSMRFAARDSKYQITTTATDLIINRGDTAKVNIRFTASDTLPTLASTHPDTVVVYSGALSTPVKFPLTGRVVSSIVFNPTVTAINIGDVAVNTPKDSTIKVYNRTKTPYKIDSLSIVSGQDFFILSNSLTTQLPAGDSTTIQFQFKPRGAGIIRDTISIWHNFSTLGIANPRKVALVGNGTTQQVINPSNYITVDNVRGLDGFPTSSPDSSYVETGPFWQNAAAVDYGGTGTGHRRSPNLAGVPDGSSARYTFRVDSTASYLIYHHVLSSANIGEGFYLHLRKFGVGGIFDSLRYNMQWNFSNILGGTAGSWYPLMYHQLDGVGPNAASVTIGADNISRPFMRVDAVRLLRSIQQRDLEFGRRALDFGPTRVPEEFGQITLSDELVKKYRLYNLGRDTLTITNIRLLPTLTPVPWFYTKNFSAATPIKIAPLSIGQDGKEQGGWFDLDLAFSPFQEGNARDSMVISSNDENEPESYVVLYGEGVNYNFIMNASSGNQEPHFRAPAPPVVPKLPLYREVGGQGATTVPGGFWQNSVRSPITYPIPDGNLNSRVNTGDGTTVPHMATYEFQLPELVLGKINTDGRYLLEYSGPSFSPNAYTETKVKVTHTFGVPVDSAYFNARLIQPPVTWVQIGGSAKTFFLAPGGVITVDFIRDANTEARGGTIFLRTDLLRVRKVPTGPLIGVDVAQGAIVGFTNVSFRNPAGLDGKANKKDVLIASLGESQLVVNSIRFRSGRYFRIVNQPSPPVYLRALTGELKLTIEFVPDRIAQDFRDTLELRSNSGRDSLLLVPVAGQSIGGVYVLDDDGATQEVSSSPTFGGFYTTGWDRGRMNNWQLEASNTAETIGRGKTRRLLPIYFNGGANFEWYPFIPTDPASGDSVLVNVAVTVQRGIARMSPRARYKIFSTGGNITKDTLVNQNSGIAVGSSVIEINLGNHYFLRGGRDVAGGQAFFGHVRLENDTAAVSAFYPVGTNFARRDTFALVADAVILRELDRAQPLVTNVENDNLPLTFSLSQNFPNPFNPSTTINFSLPEVLPVDLRIYDLLGREIAVLFGGDVMNPGRYSVRWDGRNGFGQSVATGVYFYRIVAGGYVQSKKMVLVK